MSVGLPVYNGARYVARSIESILAQDMPDLELVISDNGSTDGTREILQRFADRDPRVQLVLQAQNRGGAWNFNEVFRLGRAPYFKWACHDDWIDPSYLRRCLAELEAAGAGVVLVYPRTMLVDANGDAIGVYEDRLAVRGARPHQRLRHLVRNLALCNPVQGLIRRSALERTRLHGAYPGSDQVLLAELALLGEFRELPDALFYRRRHAEASRAANPSLAEIAAWFDPNTRVGVGMHFRRFRENLAAIARAPYSSAERLHCAFTYAFGFATRRARVRLGALRRRLLDPNAPTRTHAPPSSQP